MYSKLKLFGHPIHPMLVAFPIAMYTATFIAYIIYAALGDPFWFHLAFVANVAGVLMALLTAIPGFLDWLIGIPNGIRAKSDGLKHMLLNVTALLVFAINLLFYVGEWNAPNPNPLLAILLSLVGVLITVGAGFFGWTLIQNDHVGVNLTPEQARYEPAGEKLAETERVYGHSRN